MMDPEARVRLENLERRTERLENAPVTEQLATLQERTRNMEALQKEQTNQIDALKGRITAFAWTIAGGAVLFAVSTAVQVITK